MGGKCKMKCLKNWLNDHKEYIFSIVSAIITVGCFVILGTFWCNNISANQERYDHCEEAIEYGDYEAAYRGFIDLGSYKDAKQRAEELIIPMNYQLGIRYYAHGVFPAAIYYFYQCGDYEDAEKYIEKCMVGYIIENQITFDPETGERISDTQ